MRWSDSTHGERLKSAKICLNLAKKPGEVIWGYLWGHFWRLAAQRIDSLGDVIVAAGATFGAGSGRIHVADARNYRVVMLDEGGRFVTDYVLSHRRGGPFSPMQVAVSPDGRQLYATDLANDRVVVLTVAEESATD